MERLHWKRDPTYNVWRTEVQGWRLWVSQAGSSSSFGWYWGATGTRGKHTVNVSLENRCASERAAKAMAVAFARS